MSSNRETPGGALGAAPRASRRPLTLALGLATLLLAALPFTSALDAEFLNWDDPTTIVTNEHWRGFTREHLTWMATARFFGKWQPVPWFTYAVDHELAGLDARAFHRSNLLYHALAAGAFFLLLLELLRAARGPSRSAARPVAAFLGALFFAVHPLRVESVAWVTERQDMLSGLFWCLAVWAYLRARRAPAAAGERGRVLGWCALSLAAFALSLASKAWGVTLPAVLLLLDLYPLGRLELGRGWAHAARRVPRLVLEKTPWWLLAAAGGWLGAAAQATASATVSWEHYGLSSRLAQAAYGLVFYPLRTLWPSGLAPLYPIDPVTDWSAPATFVPAIAAVLLTVVVLLPPLARRGFAVTWLVFAVVISPVLGLTQSGSQLVADRYSYLACLPFAALAAGGVEALAARGRAALAGTLALGAAALLLLSVAAARQTAIWHDSTSLWEACVARTAKNHVAHFNLGTEYERLGRDADALAEFEAAVRLHPGMYNYQLALGLVAGSLGDDARAAQAFEQASAAEPGRPEPLAELGRTLLALDRAPEAVAAFQRAQDLHADATTHRNLALALQAAGVSAAALEEAQRAVARAPGDAAAQNLLGGLLRELERPEEGIRACLEALRLDPGLLDAHKNLALLYDDAGDVPATLRHLREVVQGDPDVRFAHLYAWLLATASEAPSRNGAEAVRWAKWVNEQTGYSRARFLTTLAAAQAEAGDFAEAVRAQERALAVAPEPRKAEHRRRLEQLRAGERFVGGRE